MTDLIVRKIGWEFDATVPFMWQPANPNFGLFCNAFTFIAVPFERYIVSAVRMAADRLAEKPRVAAEADGSSSRRRSTQRPIASTCSR